MRQLNIILGFIAAVSALIFSVSPLYKIAYLPGVAAIVFGLVAFYFSKQQQRPRKTVQLILLLTLISLLLTTYKAIFTFSEPNDIEALEIKERDAIKDPKNPSKDSEINVLPMDDSESIIDTIEVED